MPRPRLRYRAGTSGGRGGQFAPERLRSVIERAGQAAGAFGRGVDRARRRNQPTAAPPAKQARARASGLSPDAHAARLRRAFNGQAARQMLSELTVTDLRALAVHMRMPTPRPAPRGKNGWIDALAQWRVTGRHQ